MALFKNLKQIKQAMSPDAIKQGLDAGRAAMSGSPANLTDEQLAAMAPEQRAAYDAAMQEVARGQAEAAAAHRELYEREVARRALYGPAGEHVYGALPPAAPQEVSIEETMATTKEQFKDVLRNPFGASKPPPPPGAPTGAVDRDPQSAAERAARSAAREPYLAPDRQPLTFSRLATRSKTQIQEVAAYLGSSGLTARADLVFGVYRVPDHIGGGVFRGGTRVVEWDVVHATAPELTPAAPATAPFFEAEERWVRRREGERAPLDEDLALAYLARAGIGPQQSLGIARALEIKDRGGENQTPYTVTQVTGVHVFHPEGLGAGAFRQLRDERPLSAEPQDGVRTEVLNWHAIARAVQPETHRPYVVPSPFPYLPSTPQELLRAYLEIVGVRPGDSYGVQVTEDEPRDIKGVSQKGPITVSTNRGDEQLCADGVMRRRLAGGSRVVVVYRDRPEYTEGRDRWAAYEQDVLQAALSHGTNLRPAVQRPGYFERGAVGRVLRGAEHVYDFVEGIGGDDPFEKIPPYRYCWPLAE